MCLKNQDSYELLFATFKKTSITFKPGQIHKPESWEELLFLPLSWSLIC